MNLLSSKKGRVLAITLIVAIASCQTKPTQPLGSSYKVETADAETIAAQAVQTRQAGGVLFALIPKGSPGDYSHRNMPQDYPWPRAVLPYDDNKYSDMNAPYRSHSNDSVSPDNQLLQAAKDFNKQVTTFLARQDQAGKEIGEQKDTRAKILLAKVDATESKRVLHIIQKRLSLRGRMLFLHDWQNYYSKSSYQNLRDQLEQKKSRVFANGKKFQAIANDNSREADETQ